MLGENRLPDANAPAPAVPAGFPRLQIPGSFGGAQIPFATADQAAATDAEIARKQRGVRRYRVATEQILDVQLSKV